MIKNNVIIAASAMLLFSCLNNKKEADALGNGSTMQQEFLKKKTKFM